ncbi:hypothetical protein GIW81_05720 [Hyphomicrobium sp. xq]|uniref:Uncharacterized protein n=1 Tax=Hyphomicrobium album TaxID=2665159 RepID=A0A6I3KIS5_9HYPH|nr:hypothetical protein [Hyphomicrobium album]MTD93830.1 hypothetical protein [Hyphomicrobium album]
MHRMLIAAAAAGGLLTMSYSLTPALAAPLSPVTAAAQPNVVTPVAQGYRGGGMGMGSMRGMGSRGMGIGRPGIGGAGRFAYRGGTAAPRMYRGMGRGHGHGQNHNHRRLYYAAPFVGYGAYYGDSYYRGSGCGWLRRRAEATGSGYWWSRYEECRDENS